MIGKLCPGNKEHISGNVASHKSKPSSVPRVSWIRTLLCPGSRGGAVTGVEVIPCCGLLRQTLANGALVYQSQSGGFLPRAHAFGIEIAVSLTIPLGNQAAPSVCSPSMCEGLRGR